MHGVLAGPGGAESAEARSALRETRTVPLTADTSRTQFWVALNRSGSS